LKGNARDWFPNFYVFIYLLILSIYIFFVNGTPSDLTCDCRQSDSCKHVKSEDTTTRL
jgi:hypothetical protein